MGTLTVTRDFSGIDAGTPAVTIHKGSSNKAPLLTEFLVDISGCTFDSSDDYDGLFGLDYTGKIHDPSFHRLLYWWDLDDSAGDWSAPENIPAEYANRSKAFGKKIQHVYTTGQTVNWKLEIWEPSSGKKAYASGSFGVEDPLATAEHIVLVNPNGDGDFSEITRATYPGATFHEEQLAPGNTFGGGTELAAYGGLDNVCWLFKTGGTYAMSVLHPGTGNYPYFGQYGTTSTTKPIATVANGTTAFTVSKLANPDYNELRIQNIVFDGGWTTYASAPVLKNVGGNGIIPKESWITVVADCEMRNIQGQAVRSNATDPGLAQFRVGIANTVLQGIGGGEYPIILGNSSNSDISTLCFIGNRFVDFDTMMSGPSQSSANGDHRAFIRMNTATGIHVRSCDFFRLAGGHGQPIMKLNKSGRNGSYLHVQFCAGEGSENLVNLTEDDSNKATPVQHSIVECCVFMHLPEGQRLVTGASSGQTCRATYLVTGRWSDSTLSQGDTTYRSRGIHLPGAAASNVIYPAGEDAPCESYANHAVHLRTQAQQQNRAWGGNAASVEGAASFGGTAQIWRQYNNFVHAPNQTGGSAVTTYAPIKDDDTAAGDGITRPDGNPMTFRFIGWNPAGTPDPTYSYNGAFVPSGAFEAGSPAFGAADSALIWPVDYLGRICGPNRALGASDRSDYLFDLEVAST